MKVFEVQCGDFNYGEYEADSAAGALDCFAKEAGHQSYDDVIEFFGGSDEHAAYEIDVHRLIQTVQRGAGQPVFQDSYVKGVAEVAGAVYATYRDLAEAYGLKIETFYA